MQSRKEILFNSQELWDPVKEEFVYIPEQKVTFVHTLKTMHEWEMKHKKPFIKSEKTNSEWLDYFQMMAITPNVNQKVYDYMPRKVIEELIEFINDPMTATTFSNEKNTPSREVITSEIIYYWMIKLNIPVEFQNWHLNTLIALIKVCMIKETPTKKLGRNQLLSRNRALNEQRLRSLNTTG